jgi:hypothetical protein
MSIFILLARYLHVVVLNIISNRPQQDQALIVSLNPFRNVPQVRLASQAHMPSNY